MKSSITESVTRLFPLGSIPQFVSSYSLSARRDVWQITSACLVMSCVYCMCVSSSQRVLILHRDPADTHRDEGGKKRPKATDQSDVAILACPFPAQKKTMISLVLAKRACPSVCHGERGRHCWIRESLRGRTVPGQRGRVGADEEERRGSGYV